LRETKNILAIGQDGLQGPCLFFVTVGSNENVCSRRMLPGLDSSLRIWGRKANRAQTYVKDSNPGPLRSVYPLGKALLCTLTSPIKSYHSQAARPRTSSNTQLLMLKAHFSVLIKSSESLPFKASTFTRCSAQAFCSVCLGGTGSGGRRIEICNWPTLDIK